MLRVKDPKVSLDFYTRVMGMTLLTKFETLFDNSFRTNLRLTSVLAKLAHCPHPLLNSFIFDTSLPARPGVRLILRVLGDVRPQPLAAARASDNQ